MIRTITLAAAVLASSALANPPQSFAQGSLIIPMEATLQTECGTTSAYGLIWKILYENRSGGAFSGNPVVVYWAINGAKASPNRCTPTNLHTPPTAGTATSWEDGCDFTITNTTRQPVVMVNYATTAPVLPLLFANGPITHFTTSAAKGRPFWATSSPTAGSGESPSSSALDDTTTSPARFTTIRYSGAPFIIDASDAKRVLDAMGSFAHLNKHTLTGTTDGVNRCSHIGGSAIQENYRVMMHQSTTSFIAPVYKRIANVPPKIALLDYGAGVKTVLQKYLDGAGLTGTIGTASVSGNPTAATPTYGLVYDRLRAIDDLVTTVAEPYGFLNSIDPATTKPRYKVFWAPHWRISASSLLTAKSGRACASTCSGDPGHDNPCSSANTGNSGGTAACNATADERANALDNLVYFSNKKGNGIMAQCRSIAGFEASANEYDGSWSVLDAVTTNTAAVVATPRFQYTNGIDQNALGPSGNKWDTSWDGRNCTDPDYLAVTPIANRGACHRYPFPAEPFGQIGDFVLNADDGAVSTWRPFQNVSARRTNLKRIAMTWDDYDSSITTEGESTAAGYPATYNANGNDVVTLNQKDDDPEKATIIYIGMHDLSSSVGGTRIILNTLLNLGADPIASDRSMAQPSAFIDITNSNKPTLFTSVFQVLTGTLLPDTQTFADGNGKNFMFPFTRGAVRARDADAMAVGLNDLNDNTLWNSDSQMPSPANRNLFTAFGGSVEESPSLSGSRTIKNDIVQRYWVPARVESTNLNATITPVPNPACTDVVTWENYTDKHKGKNTGGLVRVAGGDGICDLAQALQYTTFSWDLDVGGKKKKPSDLEAKMATALPEVEQFVQVVRGFCYAKSGSTRLLTPTDTQCAAYNSTQDNRAHMGGAVNSTAAIVPPSSKITDSGAARPTVAYVGGWDGQLHAIYVGGGSGYTGPAGGLNFVDFNTGTNTGFALQPTWTDQVHPAHTFKTNFAAQFAAGTVPLRGRELWAYLPSTQLPLLKSNAAKIDSSPVVQDVFVDFDGDGVRSWHTVLVCSLGGTSSQIFAMDITNPLQPVLLWDIVGTNTSGLNFLSAARSDWRLTGSARPLEWNNRTSDFTLPPVTDPGRSQGYAYDFGDMGGSRALALAEMRLGLEPAYVVFVAANSSAIAKDVGCTDCAAADAPSKGLVVYALDVSTGQKLWSWSQPYLTSGTGFRSADNSVPPPPAVRMGPDGASTILVGDMEGRLWELNAATGQNVHALRNGSDCTTASCNFAAFDTQGTDTAPEPITSTIALTKVPAAPTGLLASYGGDTVAIFGTRGTNWVPRTLGGNLSTLLLDTQRHRPVVAGAAAVRTAAMAGGVMVNPSGLPLPLTVPDRVYGNITVSGQTVFVPIVTPPSSGVYDDPKYVSALLGGKTLMLDLGGVAATDTAAGLASFSFANFGGVAAFNIDTGGGVIQSTVLGDQVGKTSKYRPAAGVVGTNKTATNASLRANNPVPYRLYNAIRRFLSQQ